MCFVVPKVVRSPGCDHGHDEESRNGRDMKIDILDDYIRTPEWFRGLSDIYRSTGDIYRSTEDLPEDEILVIQDINLALNPILCIICVIAACSTVSNALAKSNLRRIISCLEA